ncbi:MAG: hypothetical protein KDB68_06095 [Planctomycetes bacterium]|nr:hypothetical protein [Planctomycetota bacterium]
MSTRARVIMALSQGYPEEVRFDIGETLESAGWVPTGDNHDCWMCRAQKDEIDEIERKVRKIIEFAAFTVGVEGRLSFVMKVDSDEPRTCAVRIGSGGIKTKPIPEKSRGLDFATKNVPGGSTEKPNGKDFPGVTQLKTAF